MDRIKVLIGQSLMSDQRSSAIVIGLLSLASFCFSPNISSAQDLPDLLEIINPEVVSVVSYDSLYEPTGQGTGFFISPDRVITCWHVVEDYSYIAIFTEDDSMTSVDSVGAIDWEGDLVELWVEPEGEEHSGLSLASNVPRQGETIIVVGNPLGLDRSISDGLVASIRTIPEFGEIIQITAPISPGSSGSPVINMSGEVIGVASFMMVDGQNVNFAIPTERIVNIRQNYNDQLAQIIELVKSAMSEDITSASRADEAEQLMEQGDYAEAAKVWEDVLSDTLDYFYGTFNYGMCLLNSGSYRLAASQFDKANELKETSEAYYNRYLSFIYLGDSTQALLEIEKALELDPSDSSCQVRAGTLNYNLENYSRAISIFGDYLDHYLDDHNSMSLFCYSLYYAELDTLASSCFEMYLSLEPDDMDVTLPYAMTLNVVGEYKKALTEFEKYFRVYGGDYILYWGMAVSHYYIGDTASSLEYYRKAADLDSSMAELHNEYGVLLQGSGQYVKALEQYEKAVRIDPLEWMYYWNLGNTSLYLKYDEKGSEALRKAKLLKKAAKSTGGK